MDFVKFTMSGNLGAVMVLCGHIASLAALFFFLLISMFYLSCSPCIHIIHIVNLSQLRYDTALYLLPFCRREFTGKKGTFLLRERQ